jgi:hypothetical protein
MFLQKLFSSQGREFTRFLETRNMMTDRNVIISLTRACYNNLQFTLFDWFLTRFALGSSLQQTTTTTKKKGRAEKENVKILIPRNTHRPWNILKTTVAMLH